MKASNKYIQINTSLVNILQALESRGHPQNTFESIHIVGTNGKGSVASFLELLYCHYFPEKNIAKYTSPHLISVTERIRVNCKEILQDDFDSLYATCHETLTEFEKITLVAFEYFREQKVDIAILEAGMGARWDATNTTAPSKRLATVLTNVALDHMDYLGETVEQIRVEKECIKRDGVPHFEGKYSESMPNSITGQNFLLALEVFHSLTGIDVSQEKQKSFIDAFGDHHKGRFVYKPENKLIIDGAHNPAGAKLLNQFIRDTVADLNQKKVFVLAFLDKDYKSFCENLFSDILSPGDLIIATEVDSERKMPASVLATELKQLYPGVEVIESKSRPDLAVYQDNLKIVTGSLYLLGAVLASHPDGKISRHPEERSDVRVHLP
jgi:folylpolyglutamate synthase/dihydropteroate synthase